MDKIFYSFNFILNYKIFYKDNDSIFIFINFSNNLLKNDEFVNIVKELRKNYKNIHYFFMPWYFNQGIDQYDFLSKYSNSVTILSNTNEEYYNFNKIKYNTILCNQNCWLDENLFTILPPKLKTFDIVYNANDGVVKNHYLLKNIIQDYKSLFITYPTAVCERVDLTEYNPTKMITEVLEKIICNFLNLSKIGLYFTIQDGSCYASSEYLLCGLPVISTASLGGRDMWYNDNNSIIISKDENELKDAIDYILKNYNEKYNYQNRFKIREEHISKQKMFRKVFTDYVKPLFKSCGILEDPEEVLKRNFSNKMLIYNQI